ncbi:MAG TPA: hypothetical protein PKD15_03915 [Candidatus Saccharibacteria bacterium]|nr:hypothetical protein [Candidatus Saccharibacteria bacterium]
MAEINASPFYSAGVEQWGGYVLLGEQDPIHALNQRSDDFLSMLSAGNQVRAEVVVSKMVDVSGIDGKDIRFVPENTENGVTQIVAIDASPNGLYGGKYNEIKERLLSDPQWMKIECNGQVIDLLSATTYAVYWAMICGARTENKVIPDSIELSQINDMPWTATMLTGEQLTEVGHIYVGSVSSNTVNTVDHRPNRGGKTMRLRPSAILGTVETPKKIDS